MENYQENSRRTRRVEATSVVLAHLMMPQPVYTQPELPLEPPTPEVIHITDRGHGWTADGEYI